MKKYRLKVNTATMLAGTVRCKVEVPPIARVGSFSFSNEGRQNFYVAESEYRSVQGLVNRAMWGFITQSQSVEEIENNPDFWELMEDPQEETILP